MSVMPFKDPEAKKAYDKKYRQENKEKIKALRRKYYKENKEKILANEKKYRGENKEKISAREKKRYKEGCAKKPSVVYMIECKATNKYYIGQTSSWFEERVRLHRNKFNNLKNDCGIGMQEDYNIHGPDAFEYSILKELSPDASEEELLAAEKECINNFIKEGKELYNKFI